MKQPIDPSEILEGDLIRIEGIPGTRKGSATEYRAHKDGDTFTGDRYLMGTEYYLLDRPEPPFEPYWGSVIGHPSDATLRAVYVPANEEDYFPWCTLDEGTGFWNTDSWAERKLAAGWVVIDPPEGVKTKEDIEREGH